MGKPYKTDLDQLADTYDVAMRVDIAPLLTAVESSIFLPLYAVGSGGALTVAHFLADLHQRFTQKAAKAVTPLELTERRLIAKNGAICFISAGGRNSDIKSAFRMMLTHEPPVLTVTCANRNSPLAQLASQYHYVDIFDFDLPSKRDGFLATNSLIAFSVVFARAYHKLFIDDEKLPPNLWDLLDCEGSQTLFLEKIRKIFLPIKHCDNFIILYSSNTKPAAYDLESKFTEAALGSVLLSDYRNFAHGRHNWLAKKADNSCIIALISDQDKYLAEKTLKLLPQTIPSARFNFFGDKTNSSLKALVTVLYVVAVAGESKGIDPGRPGIPPFGRKIYRLGFSKTPKTLYKKSMAEMAVLRKLNSLSYRYSDHEAGFWNKAYEDFTNKLGKTYFGAIVFDYDETLCDKNSRFGNLETAVTDALVKLLSSGVRIGIATGRGKSVRVALRNAIPPQFWEYVIVGYYNGADCAFLANDKHPNSTEFPDTELAPIADALLKNALISRLSQITMRKAQISILPNRLVSIDTLWPLVNILVQEHVSCAKNVVTSGHSIDILAPGVSKRNVVVSLRTMLNLDSDINLLCIGDCGRWPGNDFELLQEPYSLSVKEVSPLTETCWNLAPFGYRGVQATLSYLNCLRPIRGGLSFKIPANRKVII